MPKLRFAFYLLFAILICIPNTSYSQKKNKKIIISGYVKDENQKPVEGAVLFVDKEKTDVLTGPDGYYKIKVGPNAKELLVFTLLQGAAEKLIGDSTTINFILSPKSAEKTGVPAQDNNEFTNVGYGSVKNRNMTEGVGSVDATKSIVPYQSIYDMIRGRVPGVEVSGKSIKMSGSSSLNISTEPLFVVDGIIVNSIDDIAPETVKTIEVLKGPAASVYGTRGANGVILITRKTGKD